MLTPDSEEIRKVIEKFDEDDKAVLLFLVIMFSLSNPELKLKLNEQLEPHGIKVPGIEEINWGALADAWKKKEDICNEGC